MYDKSVKEKALQLLKSNTPEKVAEITSLPLSTVISWEKKERKNVEKELNSNAEDIVNLGQKLLISRLKFAIDSDGKISKFLNSVMNEQDAVLDLSEISSKDLSEIIKAFNELKNIKISEVISIVNSFYDRQKSVEQKSEQKTFEQLKFEDF